jgi:hypothetical protein
MRAGAVVLAVSGAAVAAAFAVGCGFFQPGQTGEHGPLTLRLVAVLPIEPAPAPSENGQPPAQLPAEDGGLAITAQVYRVLADHTEFRVVPDLTVADVAETPAVRRAGSLVDRAVALGKEVGADGVIFGRVFRFQKRVGTEYGASQAASVWFELDLVAVATGDIVWHGVFDQTQEPLTSNLFNWWMFWRAGPRWISAGELAGLGVDQLFAQMTASVKTEG